MNAKQWYQRSTWGRKMERSRSKRSYYYDQDYESESQGSRTKQRYNNNNNNNHYPNPNRHSHNNNHNYNHHHRAGPNRPVSKPPDTVVTSYRILCHDLKAGGVIGKSGSIIKSIRQHTGAWINVHELIPDKENIVTTRLLVSPSEIGCFEGRDGMLSDLRRLPGVAVQILPREELPLCVSRNDEILQIVGEIRAARDALVEVTSRLRSYLYGDALMSSLPVPVEAPSYNNNSLAREGYAGSDIPVASHLNAPSVLPKATGVLGSEMGKQNEIDRRDEAPSGLTRIAVPLVTRSILEVVLPEYAVPKLVTKSRNKLAQISELSGATVKVVDDRPEVTEKVIQLSGTQEQVERAQSLLQGFILSTQEEE